jgi:hypothetical protein
VPDATTTTLAVECADYDGSLAGTGMTPNRTTEKKCEKSNNTKVARSGA